MWVTFDRRVASVGSGSIRQLAELRRHGGFEPDTRLSSETIAVLSAFLGSFGRSAPTIARKARAIYCRWKKCSWTNPAVLILLSLSG